MLTLELNCDAQSIRSSLMKCNQYRYDDRKKEKKGRRSGNGWHSVPHGALGAILKLSSGGRMGEAQKQLRHLHLRVNNLVGRLDQEPVKASEGRSLGWKSDTRTCEKGREDGQSR
jgi:hypothetical protein